MTRWGLPAQKHFGGLKRSRCAALPPLQRLEAAGEGDFSLEKSGEGCSLPASRSSPLPILASQNLPPPRHGRGGGVRPRILILHPILGQTLDRIARFGRHSCWGQEQHAIPSHFKNLFSFPSVMDRRRVHAHREHQRLGPHQ